MYRAEEIRILGQLRVIEMETQVRFSRLRANVELNGRGFVKELLESLRTLIENCKARITAAFDSIQETLASIVEKISPYISAGNPPQLIEVAGSWDALTKILQTLEFRVSPQFFKAHEQWSGGVADNYRYLINSQAGAVSGIAAKPRSFAEFLTNHASSLIEMWIRMLETLSMMSINIRTGLASVASNAAPWDWVKAIGPLANTVAAITRGIVETLSTQASLINEYYRSWRSVTSALVDSTGFVDGAWPSATLV